jgi:hypothetical protein
MAINDNEFINPNPPTPIDDVWVEYTHLDPWSSTTQAFYEFRFTQQLQFRNYKIECYSTIWGRIGRFIGWGKFQVRTGTYFVVVNGRDYTTEDHLGENSLYGYPTGYSEYDGVGIVFFLVDRYGNKYPLRYTVGTEPEEFSDKNFSQSTASVNINHRVNVNPVKVRKRNVSTRNNNRGNK